MKTRRRFVALATAAALVMGGGVTLVATAGPAYAQTPELCLGSGGYTDECLNAWFGGPPVYDWHGGVAYDAFLFELIDRCDSSGTSTANCPIHGNPTGKWVVEIRDTRTQHCVGDANNDPNNSFAGEVACNGSNGYGGGWGTVFLVLGSSYGCYGGSLRYFNAHWMPLGWGGVPVGLKWPGGAYGDQVSLNNIEPYCIYQDEF